VLLVIQASSEICAGCIVFRKNSREFFRRHVATLIGLRTKTKAPMQWRGRRENERRGIPHAVKAEKFRPATRLDGAAVAFSFWPAAATWMRCLGRRGNARAA